MASLGDYFTSAHWPKKLDRKNETKIFETLEFFHQLALFRRRTRALINFFFSWFHDLSFIISFIILNDPIFDILKIILTYWFFNFINLIISIIRINMEFKGIQENITYLEYVFSRARRKGITILYKCTRIILSVEWIQRIWHY